MNKAQEIREKSAAECQVELEGLLREQFNLRMQNGAGQLTKHHQLRNVRRQIARIKTIMQQEQLKGEAE